ncbi:MAG: hypothetical protein LC733_04030 [Actinobacteria bacterium]|nr:hypothetical protein [Actinomycetota bacterium]
MGTVAMLVVTRRGPYLSADGLAYVGMARNLVDGHGFTPPPGAPPLGNFPPLYPLLLAVIGFLGPDPLTVARFLSPVLFGMTVLLVGLLCRRVTGSLALAVTAQLLVVSGVDLLAYHSTALSEPLFLLLALATLLALTSCLARPRPRLVVAAAGLAATTCLTRYLGLAVVLTGAAALALLASGRRWGRALTFAALALTPLVGWLAWVAATEGRASNRTAVFHAPDGGYATRGLRSASTWFLPADFSWPLRAAVAAAAVAALVWVAWRRRGRLKEAAEDSGAARTAGPILLAVFAVTYLAALVVDRFLFDVTGRLDSRFLLPVHVVAVILILGALARLDLLRSRAAWMAISALAGLQVAAGASWVYDAAKDAAVRPGGFTAPAWQRSEVIAHVRALAPAVPVFTNQVDALYFHTGRTAQPLPARAEFLTGRTNQSYEDELAGMVNALGDDGMLVYFTAPPARRAFLDPPAEVAARLGLEMVVADGVGVLYRPAGSRPGSG